MPVAHGRFPQVSGFCFVYDISAPVDARVISAVRQAPDGRCTGASIDFTASSTYTLGINDFMASGGDGYPVMSGRAAVRDTLDQMLADFVKTASPLSSSIQGRIVCTDSNPSVSNPSDATACPIVIQ